jgi:hypothetical protein
MGVYASIGDEGACRVNAVVEKLLGSLIHDWILKITKTLSEHMKQYVTAYMNCYN